MLKILIAVCILLFIAPTYAADHAAVESACAGDYFSFCSSTVPFSAANRACMRAHGLAHQLSSGCLQALSAAGEVTKTDRHSYFGKKPEDVAEKPLDRENLP